MAPTKLKIKGNKAFSLLSAIDTDEDLSKTWRLMTKVKDALEYGMRLENLSWRLWFMHHLMVHDQKTRTQFKKLSNATTKKLETEKGTDLKELSVPSYRPKNQEQIIEKKGKKKVKKGNQKNDKTSRLTKQSPKNYANNCDKNDFENNGQNAVDDNMELDIVNDDEMITTVTQMIDQSDNNMAISGCHDEAFNASVDENAFDGNSIIMDEPHEFALRQYTSDQDPYQVITLPNILMRYNIDAVSDPNQQPLIQLDMNQLIGVYNFGSSSDSSEPNSPTEIDWFAPSDMRSNLQYQISLSDQLVGRSSSGMHNAVYVPRTADSSPVNSNTLNTNLITSMSNSMNTPLNTPVGGLPSNSILNGVSNSNLLYMDQYSSEQANTVNSMIIGQQGSKPAIISPLISSTSSIMLIENNGSKPAVSSPSPSSPTSDSSIIAARVSSSTSTSSENRSKKTHSNGEQQCFNCGVTSTPLWRRSANDELLCNACGLYLKLHKMARPKTMKPHIVRKDARDDEAAQPVCSNCNTMTTPLWRRDEEGQTLCNACGLYFKLHNERRPLSMKTDVIKKRQRYENGQTPNRRTNKKQRPNEQDRQEIQQQSPPQLQQVVSIYNSSIGV